MASNIDIIIKIQDEVTSKIENLSKKVEGLEGKFKHAEKQAEKFGDSVGKVAEKLAALFAIEKVIEWGKAAYEQADAIDEAQGRLENTINNVNAEHAMTVEQLTMQADKMRSIGDFAKQDLIDSQERIARLGLAADKQEKLNELAINYAAFTKTSAKQGADALAEMYTKPKAAISVLSQAGIKLSAEQKKGITDGTIAAEDMMNIIEQRTAGFAALQRDKNMFAGIQQAAEELSVTVGPIIESAFKEIEPILLGIAKVLKDVFIWIDKNKVVLGLFAEVVGTIILGFSTWITYTKLLEAAQFALNLVMEANPIGLVIIAIASIVVGLIYAYQHFEKFRAIVDGTWAALKVFADVVGDVFIGLGKIIAGTITLDPSLIKEGWGQMSDAAKDAGAKIANAYVSGYNTSIEASHTASAASDAEELLKKNKKNNNNNNNNNNKKDNVLSGGSTGSGSHTAPTQINITIEKFGEVHIATTNMHEAPRKVHAALLEALTDALNDSQNLATRHS